MHHQSSLMLLRKQRFQFSRACLTAFTPSVWMAIRHQYSLMVILLQELPLTHLLGGDLASQPGHKSMGEMPWEETKNPK
eukprot:10488370-Karenia_brevis.AAC.1